MHHVKEQVESFFLNGHSTGFRPQTQKLESLTKLHQALWQ